MLSMIDIDGGDDGLRYNHIESFTRSIFSAVTALKIVSKCSFTTCKLRFFDYFCLAMTKNLHRAKLSHYYLHKKFISQSHAVFTMS